MPSLNKLFVIGNVVGEPEFKTTQNDNQMATFSLAVNNYRKGQEDETDFFDCIAWGRVADSCSNMEKGAMVHLEGAMRQSSWTNQEGQKRSRWQLVVHRVQFLSSRKKQGDYSPKPEPAPDPGFKKGSAPATNDNDDLPF